LREISSTASIASGMVSRAWTSASLMCSVMDSPQGALPGSPIRNMAVDGSSGNPSPLAALGRFRLTAAGRFFCCFVSLRNAPDDGLNQSVHAILFTAVERVKTKFGLSIRPLTQAHRELAARGVVDKRGFVARSFEIPGIYAKYRKVAGLAFWSARAGHQILWF